MFELNSFISKYVTKRPVSMFLADIKRNKENTGKYSSCYWWSWKHR